MSAVWPTPLLTVAKYEHSSLIGNCDTEYPMISKYERTNACLRQSSPELAD